ncbi:aldo/keto reductase [bacterium]|nr:aldo/keto reductase [bacterium]
MLYRQLGRTGLKVSQLGFGAMRLPMSGEGDRAVVNRELAVPMIHRAFEAGVNYIDSAVGYCNHDSQRAVGDALKGWRDKIVVSTKNPDYSGDEKSWWPNLEHSLERLQVDTIDIYNHHGLNWARWTEVVEPKISKWMQRAKDQGLIRHICFSTHDTPEGLMKLIDLGYADVVTLQYNILDRKFEDCIAHAHESGMGVVVMGPVGGGRLGESSEVLDSMLPQVKRVPELALRFVLSNPNVSLALSGMSMMQQVEENVQVTTDSTPLSKKDKTIIAEQLERLASMADLYCTGCLYCMPCPSHVNIARIFQLYNQGRVYGIWDHARRAYRSMMNAPEGKRSDVSACTECAACETQCPQNIPIRQQLKQAHEALIGEDR